MHFRVGGAECSIPFGVTPPPAVQAKGKRGGTLIKGLRRVVVVVVVVLGGQEEVEEEEWRRGGGG